MKTTNILLFFLGCIAFTPYAICMSEDLILTGTKRKRADTQGQQVQPENLETLSNRMSRVESSLAGLTAQQGGIISELDALNRRGHPSPVPQIPMAPRAAQEATPKASPAPKRVMLPPTTSTSKIPPLLHFPPQKHLDRAMQFLKEKRVSSAIACLEKAAEQTLDLISLRRAQLLLSSIYVWDAAHKDYAKALSYLLLAAQTEDLANQTLANAYLAEIYMLGDNSVQRNFAKALSYLIPLSTQTQDLKHRARAQVAIGRIYAHGDSTIERSFHLALLSLRLTVEQTHDRHERVEAHLLQAIIYLLGDSKNKISRELILVSIHLACVMDSSYEDFKSPATTILNFLNKEQINEACTFAQNYLNQNSLSARLDQVPRLPEATEEETEEKKRNK